MFTSLHPLAQQATLMITIAAEGDDQLRVNVTPMPADTKAKNNLPQPLSLVASPAEFDVDFAAALLNWQTPKRSLIEQVQAATGGAAAPTLPAPAAKAGGKTEKARNTGKRGGKGATDESAALQDAGEAAGIPAAADDQAATGDAQPGLAEQLQGAGQLGTLASSTSIDDAAAPIAQQADAEPASAQAAADGEEPIDKFTLDLF